MRTDGVHVPGPDEGVRAGAQLRRKPPDPLPAHQHHGDGARAHGRIERQVDPGSSCLRRGAEVGWACTSDTISGSKEESKEGGEELRQSKNGGGLGGGEGKTITQSM